MKAGDFVVIKGSGPASDLVEWAEGSNWTHVMSAIDSDHYLNPVWPYLLRVNGELRGSTHQFFVSPDGLTDQERYDIGKYLESLVGKHYGAFAFIWAGFTIWLPFLRYIHNPLKKAGYVCSTSLAYAYDDAGCLHKLLRGGDKVDPECVTPSMLAEIWGAA